MTLATTAAPLTTPGWVDRAAWPYAARTFVHPEGRVHYVDESRGAPLALRRRGASSRELLRNDS